MVVDGGAEFITRNHHSDNFTINRDLDTHWGWGKYILRETLKL